MAFILTHLIILSLFAWIQQHSDAKIVSWRSIETTFRELPAHVLLERLLLVPIQEELLFRGLLLQLSLNRLHRRAVPSAVVTNLLFAAVHLLFNARRLSPSDLRAYLFYQVGLSFIIGTFLSLRAVVSGSLLECIILHCINNVFALAADQSFITQLDHPLVLASGTAMPHEIAALSVLWQLILSCLSYDYNRQLHDCHSLCILSASTTQ